jgi:drug/metabolite transporter (DMT)-like permease
MEASEDSRGITIIQKDLLWGLYQEARSHARLAELLRSSAVNYMVLVASALITVITFDKQLNLYDLPLCIIVSLIGLVTALFSASYAELYHRNRQRAEHFLARLDATFFENKAPATLFQIKADADDVHHKTKLYRWSRRVTGSTHMYWLVLPVLVFAVGAFLTCLSLSGLTSGSN